MKTKRYSFLTVLILLGLISAGPLMASDHDDGENDVKARALNLTDLYVFREGDQTDNPADNDKLILIMNTNPRSVARQQYYFSTRARYEFHLSRVADTDSVPTGQEDIVLRFEFGAPDASGVQQITVTSIIDGTVSTATTTTGGGPIMTTTLAEAGDNGNSTNNEVHLAGENLTVFAGLREDPFFFDVEAFFRVRAALLGLGPTASFLDPDNATDFARGYNVNAIVVRVPISLLSGTSGTSVFDVWETISIPDTISVP